MQFPARDSDGTINEKDYQAKLNELRRVLSGEVELDREGNQNKIYGCLQPLDNDVYLENFHKEFYGREWLLASYESWFAEQKDSKFFWITGNAGMGKTAFIAELCHRHPEISAVHFCRYNDIERSDPKRIIKSLAYHLSTQVPEYQDSLFHMAGLESLKDDSVQKLFEKLFIIPMRKMQPPDQDIVIVIDALDEASRNGRNELVDVIATEFLKTPPWLRLIITSRPEPELFRKLSFFSSFIMEKNEEENLKDISGYLVQALQGTPNLTGSVISNIVQRSEGSFLFAKQVVYDIREQRIDLDNPESIPMGMTGIYNNYLDRLFGDSMEEDYTFARKIIEVLVASYEPLTIDRLVTILGEEDYAVTRILEKMYSLFSLRDNKIEPLHKSLIDWITDRRLSGRFYISERNGDKRIISWLTGLYEKNRSDNYLTKYFAKHLLKDENYELASNVLVNKKIQLQRIKLLGLDSAMRNYLDEIELIARDDEDSALALLGSKTFLDFLSQHRKFFYNTGLFFQLKKCGFDEVLEMKDEIWDCNTEVACAYYRYITEDFVGSISSINEIFSKEVCKNDPDLMAELNNVIALCYRKEADFKLTTQHLESALELAEQTDKNYDNAATIANLAKVAYHELNWDLADARNKEAVKLLEQELNDAGNEDDRSSIELFLAEFNRLSSEAVIWNFKVDEADKYLQNAERIYANNSWRDRYYLRFLYTSALLDIFHGKFDEAEKTCKKIIGQAQSVYDKSQIEYYWAMALFLQGKYTEALTHAHHGYRHANKIKSWLEREELLTLGLVISNKTNIIANTLFQSHSDKYYSNKNIRLWVDYLEKSFWPKMIERTL